MHPYVHCSVLHGGQDMETIEVSVNGWLDKENVAYIYIVEYYLAIKKITLPFATTWMDLENIVATSQYYNYVRQKKSRTVWFHSHVGDKTESNKWTNKKKKQTKTHGQGQQ